MLSPSLQKPRNQTLERNLWYLLSISACSIIMHPIRCFGWYCSNTLILLRVQFPKKKKGLKLYSNTTCTNKSIFRIRNLLYSCWSQLIYQQKRESVTVLCEGAMPPCHTGFLYKLLSKTIQYCCIFALVLPLTRWYSLQLKKK